MIKIGAIGYNHIHDKNFFVDRPEGIGCYLGLLVKRKSLFRINKKSFTVEKNSFILISPHVSVFYKAASDSYADDWFFFTMEEGDLKKIEEWNLKMDVPYPLEDTADLEQLIHLISFENYSDQKYHEEIKQGYTEIFFLKLSRLINEKKKVSVTIVEDRMDKITYIRVKLFDDPLYFSNVDSMADFAGLSRSGFQHLYKKTFGTSVIKDSISGRIEKAKKLLATSAKSISQIGQICGYKSDVHFMRQFKSHTGLTPGDFRKGSSWLHIEKSR